MSLAAMIKNHLESHAVPYQIVTRQAGANTADDARVPLSKTVKSVVLQDTSGLMLAVIAADHALDINALQHQLQRKIELVPPRDYVALFKDWAPNSFAPFARNYGLRILVDAQLATQDQLYFENGNPSEFVRVEREGFLKLHDGARLDVHFTAPITRRAAPSSSPTTTPEPATTPIDSAKAERMKFRIQRVTELPPMPEMAQKIFSLNSNPYARVQDLAAIVAIDPSLSAQIIRYAKSPFFGYRGKINSVHDAIARVLGYDLVMNIALGLASAAPFKHTLKGPLGLEAFWRHATYSAVLAQSLGALITKTPKPRLGMAYLSGLLHNFGYLLLGHVYPAEFKKLNDAAAADPKASLSALEMQIVGVPHTEMGTWLMEAWNMPAEVIATIREHHNQDYTGQFAVYPQLIRLVDALLKRYDLGDAPNGDIPQNLQQQLGLSEVQIDAKLNKLSESRDELDHIARHLAA